MTRPFSILRLLCTLLAASAISTPADAATFTVASCDAAPDGATNNAWVFSTSAPARFDHGDGCAQPGGDEYAGLYVQDTLGQSNNISGGTFAYWSFSAPVGTTVSTLTYSRHLRTYLDDGWRAELRTENTVAEDCVVPSVGDECDRGAAGGTSTTFPGLSASVLRVGVRCQPVAPATTCTPGSSLHSVVAALYGTTVSINDPTAPEFSSLGGELATGGWHRGTVNVSFSAQDSTGLSRLALLRDGGSVLTDQRTCDFTKPAPCDSPGASAPARWSTVDTATWPDGPHAVSGQAADAAGNVNSTPAITVRTDNTAPAIPVPSTDTAWSNRQDATWTWTIPGEPGRAPIEQIEYEICHEGACETATIPPTGSDIVITRGVEAGTTTLRARHRDAAGNVSDWSAPVFVRRDRTAPRAPSLATPKRASDGSYRIPIGLTDPGPAPIETLAGSACRVGGGCHSVRSSSPSEALTEALTPGRWIVRIHTVDEAGNVGADAEAQIRVPRLPARLKLARVRVTRFRVTIAGQLAQAATGRVRLTVLARRKQRGHTVAVRRGSFRGSLRRFGARGTRLRVRVRYLGDETYAPASRGRKIPRRA